MGKYDAQIARVNKDLERPVPPSWWKRPVEVWSQRQWILEIRRLRRKLTLPTEERGIDERIAELTSELERARARSRFVEREYAAAREEYASAGLAEDAVAGKPALADYRRIWRRFTMSLDNLPTVRRHGGMELARHAIATRVLPDLYTLQEVPSRGEWEAGEQDRLIRALQDPSFQEIFVRDEVWATRFRTRYLAQAARAFYRPSVWAIYEKASESGLLDKYGTVVK